MSYFFVTAQVPLWTGIQTRLVTLLSDIEWLWSSPPTTLSSAIWPAKASHHCINILRTPARTCFPPTRLSNSWICHKCWQERYQPLQPDWFHSKIIDALQVHFIYVQCSGMEASLWLLATANTLFESCCYCCWCFHKPSERTVKRMWLFFFFNQCF